MAVPALKLLSWLRLSRVVTFCLNSPICLSRPARSPAPNTSIVGRETHIMKCPALGYVDQVGNCLIRLRRLNYMAIEPQFEMALGFKGLGFRVDALQQVEACFQGRRFLLRSEPYRARFPSSPCCRRGFPTDFTGDVANRVRFGNAEM